MTMIAEIKSGGGTRVATIVNITYDIFRVFTKLCGLRIAFHECFMRQVSGVTITLRVP
ncbi:hypothetical protein J2S74_000220 [Evansella vedderi]|uniref:Uncharacterized protein n=1 Tax=Evansella vedderi TaxID=38282 RepID=A0ABT9ZQW8_9BACI|nr:hypothetical protein [Evansella vedderi]